MATRVEMFYNGVAGLHKETGEELHGFRLRGKKGKSFKFRASQLGDYKPAHGDGVSLLVEGQVKQTENKVDPTTGEVKYGWVDATGCLVKVVDYKRNAYVAAAVVTDFADALGDDAPFSADE